MIALYRMEELMIRKLQILVVLPAALLCLNGWAAASASAESFHSEIEPTVYTAASEANQVIKAGSAEVVCTGASYIGTSSFKTETFLKLHPQFTGCTFLGEPASIDASGCEYNVVSTTAESGTGDLPVVLECFTLSPLKVTTSGCTLAFGSQSTTGGLKATNLGSGSSRDITVDFTMTATFSKSGLACFVISGTTATFTGTATMKGFVDEGSQQFPETYFEGSQVGIWWE